MIKRIDKQVMIDAVERLFADGHTIDISKNPGASLGFYYL